jgi:hypothetical protein
VDITDELLSRILDAAARKKNHEDHFRRTPHDPRVRVAKFIEGDGIFEYLL